jgi:hypothetical protein
MFLHGLRVGAADDLLRAARFLSESVGDDGEFVGLQRCIRLRKAILHHSPYPAAKGSHFSPVFHAVSSIMVANHVFSPVIVASGNGKPLHVKVRVLQLLDGGFRFGVGFADRHDGIVFDHNN